MRSPGDAAARRGASELKMGREDGLARDSESHADGAPPPRAGASTDDEAPPGPVAERRGVTVSIRCRTVAEAYLVAKELEEAEIIAVLPSPAELVQEYRRKGYVEVTVSATAYASARELQAAVEYRHGTVRSEQPLPYSAKASALLLGFVIVPGALIYAWLSQGLKAHGYHRMAKELKLWFIMGALSWFLILGGYGIVDWLSGPAQR